MRKISGIRFTRRAQAFTPLSCFLFLTADLNSSSVALAIAKPEVATACRQNKCIVFIMVNISNKDALCHLTYRCC